MLHQQAGCHDIQVIAITCASRDQVAAVPRGEVAFDNLGSAKGSGGRQPGYSQSDRVVSLERIKIGDSSCQRFRQRVTGKETKLRNIEIRESRIDKLIEQYPAAQTV